jgi:arginine N-succinyltransferase
MKPLQLLKNPFMTPHSPFVLRRATTQDIRAIYLLTKQAKSGLSNLPKTKKETQIMLKKSDPSQDIVTHINNKTFLFALTSPKNQVVGVSGIKARTGVQRPNYSFMYHKNAPYPYLERIETSFGHSELGQLFLSPLFRRSGVGRLLSLSRLLFIRQFPHLFTTTIQAELRGYLFKNNVSPIWNALGQRFIGMSFHHADRMATKDPNFIKKAFPKHPIYLNLLPHQCWKYFQQVHPLTEPAKQLLLNENFNITNYVDIFDGGPTLEGQVSVIRTMALAKTMILNQLIPHQLTQRHIICNTSLADFRAMYVSSDTPLSQISNALRADSSDNITLVAER